MLIKVNDSRLEKIAFQEMYERYISEISAYTNRHLSTAFSLTCLSDPCTDVYFIVEDNKRVGFVIIGTKLNKHRLSDYYIAEFHIEPNERRKGYGKKAAEEIFQMYTGKPSLFVLKKNKPAREFWTNVFCSNGYMPLRIPDELMPSDMDDCFFGIYYASGMRFHMKGK